MFQQLHCRTPSHAAQSRRLTASLWYVAGNVVLYNVALLHQYGSATAAAAVWASGTFSKGPQPFKLLMQAVSP